MMQHPAPLEILLPYWGSPAYMRETVESVLAQTNPNWRLVVVDDAYPDPEIRDYLAALDDSRIRYVRKDHNEGITENFRTCVRMATQPRMSVLGCDDRLLPNYVDVILAAHARFPEATLIQPGVRVIDEAGEPVMGIGDVVKQRIVRPRGGGDQLICGEALAVNLLNGNWLYWPSLAFRKDVIQRFDFRDEFPVTQDLAIIMDMVFEGAQLLIVPEVCFEYRRHTGSASMATLLDGKRFAAERAYFELAAELAGQRGWRRAVAAARARVTSRLHALTLLPSSLKARQGLGTLLRHGLGS